VNGKVYHAETWNANDPKRRSCFVAYIHRGESQAPTLAFAKIHAIYEILPKVNSPIVAQAAVVVVLKPLPVVRQDLQLIQQDPTVGIDIRTDKMQLYTVLASTSNREGLFSIDPADLLQRVVLMYQRKSGLQLAVAIPEKGAYSRMDLKAVIPAAASDE